MKAKLRRLLHLALAFLLRLRSRPFSPSFASRCVIIAPHQDDETLGCAGLIHFHRAAGLAVDVVYITDGGASHLGHPIYSPTEIARLRRAEATLAMASLGLEPASLHFLDTPDGTLAQLSSADTSKLVQRLASVLGLLRPTALYLPLRNDGSSEHLATFRIAQQALALTSPAPRVFEYLVWARWSPRLLLATVLIHRRVWRLDIHPAIDLKRAALSAYVSQFQPTPPWSRAVLPVGFADCFLQPEEFFIEHREPLHAP